MGTKRSKSEAIDYLMNYLHKKMEKITSLVPCIRAYHIHFTDEPHNPYGGFFTVSYEPTMFIAQLCVFKNLIDGFQKTENEDAFLRFVDVALCHEIGHCIIWELKGYEELIEKTASIIGYILFEAIQDENPYNT